MIILFEGHNYPKESVSNLADDLKLDGIKVSRNGDYMSFNYVGYFFSPNKNQQVFIMPKVFVYSKEGESEEENSDAPNEKFKAFGKYSPNDFINFFDSESDESECKKIDKEFVRKISLWVYLAIRQYDNNPNHNNCIRNLHRTKISINGRMQDVTFLDLILALVDYSREYRDFIIMTAKMCHVGNNKINWNKTISKTQPIFQDNSPIYVNPIRKKKEINYDEELMVIFFSTLKYINENYHQEGEINEFYHLMSAGEYRAFKNVACQHLMRIKHRYFSDKTVKLWNLLYNYYKMESKLKSNKNAQDMLLCKEFEEVFEKMVDYLLSDEVGSYPQELSKQWDGKLIDHIYREKSLIYNDDIYYIGDSKYYKSGNDLDRPSLAKQYTYAKNIIQRNIEVFFSINYDSKGNDGTYLRYRDDLTEGYNITPNFFISGSVRRNNEKIYSQVNDEVDVKDDPSYSFDTPDLTLLEMNNHKPALISRQFKNRLFDRDTLILQRYNINFLYVLSVYCKHNSKVRDKFKSEAHNKFRENLVAVLSDSYSFYLLKQKEHGKTIKKVIDTNYRTLNGKIISFNNEIVFLALSKSKIDAESENIDSDNYELLSTLLEEIDVYEYDLKTHSEGNKVTLKLFDIEDDALVKSIVDGYRNELEAIQNIQLVLFDKNIFKYLKMETKDWRKIIKEYFDRQKENMNYNNLNLDSLPIPFAAEPSVDDN